MRSRHYAPITRDRSLFAMEHLLESLERSLLGAHVKPLKARLSAGDRSMEEVRWRSRVIPLGARRREPKHFQFVASAVKRKHHSGAAQT